MTKQQLSSTSHSSWAPASPSPFLQGAATNVDQEWVREETQVEACLGELEKDISYIGKFHERHPPQLAVAMASVHCSECARLLRHL